MNFEDILNTILFVKKKKRKRIAEEDIEEEYEEVSPKKGKQGKQGKQVSDDIDWDDETEAVVEVLPDNFQEEKKSRIPIKVPKGRALISVDKRAWIHIGMGIFAVILNIIFLGISLMGNLPLMERSLVIGYTITMIYITANYTWLKISGKKVEEWEG